MATPNNLPLPNLSIKGFRGIEALDIPRLGRATLLAGQNGVGKTTVLEAVKIYALHASSWIVDALLVAHEEFSAATDNDGRDLLEPDWESLFHGRDISQDVVISIGPIQSECQLRLEATTLSEVSPQQLDRRMSMLSELLPDESVQVLKACFHKKEWIVPGLLSYRKGGNKPLSRRFQTRLIPPMLGGERSDLELIACESLGPELLSPHAMAQYWDRVVLTDHEDLMIKALDLVYGSRVERIATVGEDSRNYRRGRRIIVKLKGYNQPVPLKSLGDGALRLFSLALALVNSRKGFLLIDEAENGIHYLGQEDYWRLVLQTARENNVQVIATTHSGDCIRGFAQAALELDDVEGMLVRLERGEDDLRAVQYSEDELKIAAEQGIEVR